MYIPREGECPTYNDDYGVETKAKNKSQKQKQFTTETQRTQRFLFLTAPTAQVTNTKYFLCALCVSVVNNAFKD
jgi:hypothetical protein